MRFFKYSGISCFYSSSFLVSLVAFGFSFGVSFLTDSCFCFYPESYFTSGFACSSFLADCSFAGVFTGTVSFFTSTFVTSLSFGTSFDSSCFGTSFYSTFLFFLSFFGVESDFFFPLSAFSIIVFCLSFSRISFTLFYYSCVGTCWVWAIGFSFDAKDFSTAFGFAANDTSFAYFFSSTFTSFFSSGLTTALTSLTSGLPAGSSSGTLESSYFFPCKSS